jgi:hypothetical protein
MRFHSLREDRIVPNYELAPALEKVEILRVVVRENMSEVVCLLLVVRWQCAHSFQAHRKTGE